MHLHNVIIPSRKSSSRFDIEVVDGVVKSVEETQCSCHTPASLLLPSLCHPHIHLDKPYILTRNHEPLSSHPDYSDLAPESGSFTEALQNTSMAKERYTSEDLYLRGSQLLATSYQQGVTAVRAFVELDHVTCTKALDQAIRLKRDFANLVEVQICAFAQDPLFATQGETNRRIITEALEKHQDQIDVLGTTPYVEDTRHSALENIHWAIRTALKFELHLDFHLDYNLNTPEDEDSLPLVYGLIQCLRQYIWSATASPLKTIVLGHCCQLTRLDSTQLEDLAAEIRSSGLPIHFVGLPTSDVFMMGRPSPTANGESTATRFEPHSRPRGTLQIPAMIKDLGLNGCIGVNNVGNAFTPFGTGDPLQLASWSVGLYQAGTPADADLLYGCVSSRARQAIGLTFEHYNFFEPGDKFTSALLIENKAHIEIPGMKVPARQRLSLKDVVWDPPDVSLRTVVKSK